MPAPASSAGKPSLGDPDSFVEGVPHDLLTEMRRTTPVAWQTLEDGSGFFAVLTHADVSRVALCDFAPTSTTPTGISPYD